MTEGTTPFAELLQDYMWRQRPPLSASKLADKLGVAKTTLWNWLHARRVPPPDALALIHEKTGIPLSELYEAAEYPLPGARVEEVVKQLPAMSQEERDQLRAALAKIDDFLERVADKEEVDESHPKVRAGTR